MEDADVQQIHDRPPETSHPTCPPLQRLVLTSSLSRAYLLSCAAAQPEYTPPDERHVWLPLREDVLDKPMAFDVGVPFLKHSDLVSSLGSPSAPYFSFLGQFGQGQYTPSLSGMLAKPTLSPSLTPAPSLHLVARLASMKAYTPEA